MKEYTKAIKQLSKGAGFYDTELRHKLAVIINEAVEPLCKTNTHNTDNNDKYTHLLDWIENGCYDGTETPEIIANEWDDLLESELLLD